MRQLRRASLCSDLRADGRAVQHTWVTGLTSADSTSSLGDEKEKITQIYGVGDTHVLTGASMNEPVPARQRGPLAGLTVLELGDGIAGAAAADILAVLGAEVTTVTSDDSVLRALNPQVSGVSVLSAVLDSRKHVVGAAAGINLAERIGAADVVICDRGHRAAAALPRSEE